MNIYARALNGASLAAVAATPAPAEPAADDTQTIVVTGHSLDQSIQTVADTPGGADVVSADEYRDRLAVSLRDALAFSAGVYAQPRFGQEVRLSIRGSGLSRGFHMRGLTLLQDGIPINLADDNGDFQELDPQLLSHIEVFRGANALRFGASTLGGAINGVTPTGRTAPGVSFRVDGGAFDTFRGLATAGVSDDRGDAFVAVAADSSDGDRDHARRRAVRFAGNVGLALGETIENRFYASVQTIRQELPGALTRAVALADPEAGSFVGDQARDIDSIRLQNRVSVTLPGGTIDAGMFLNAKQLYHPIFQVVDQESTDWGGYARLDLDRGAWGLSGGATIRLGRIASKRFVNLDGTRGTPTFDADLAARTVDLYAEGRVRPVPGLTLIAGAVYTDGLRRQDARFPTTASGRATFGEVSPKLGLLFEPGETVQLYANTSRSHELPGYSELAQIATFVPLDPQRAWTAEVGGRGWIGPVAFDVSLYRADLEGELLQFDVAPPTVPAATFNAGRTRHQGVEAALDIEPAPWLRLRQTWLYSDFRFRGDPAYGDNRLPVIPEHLYRAELRLGDAALHVSPAVEWVPRGAWADYANGIRAPGYALLGITATARLREGVDLFLDGRNLLGERGIGDVSAVVRATPANAIYYPVERRALYVGMRADF